MILGYNSGINNTLKEKLFINPTPLHQTKDEFFVLHNRIFPGRVQFIAFLDTSEEQQKKELAKDILLRLCYESNFAPVYELLLNVLNLEEKLSSDNYNYHVGRDHFIHLVNLYLLGIYTFFYNIEFYSKIYNQFHLNRNSNFNENLKLNAIKDFISSWKYFVLYHDLAYPFEYFGSDIDERLKKLNIEVLKDIRSDVFKLYNSENFRNSFIFELCIKSISKLIIVNRELKYLNNDFKNIYYHLEQKLIDKQLFKKDKKFLNVDAKEFNNICKENYKKDIYKLENIHTGESLKYILSIYKKSDLIYIVSNIITGHIIAIAFPNEDKHIIYFTEQYKNNIKFANLLSENPEMFFNDELLINDIYIDYYILNPIDKFNTFLKKVAVCEDVPQRSITINNINLIFSSVLDKENDSTIISDVDFLDYSYKFYKKLREIILADKDYSYSYFATQREVYNMHVKDIKSSFIEYCTKLTKNSLLEVGELEEYTKTGDEDVKDIISKWTRSAIDKISNINWDKESNEAENDSIISNLIKDFSIKLQARLTLNKIRDCILEKIKNNLKSIESNFYVKETIKNDIIINDEVIKNFNKDIIQEINNKIKKSFEDPEFDICKLISNYKVGYSKYDHGIYGLKIFLEHLNFYRHYFNNCICNNEIINQGCLLPWNVDNNSDFIKTKYLDNYENLIPEVGFALIMHNIYPANFNEAKLRDYRTSMNIEPFAYHAILCDSLQHWNRPYILNPALRKVDKSILSNFFNIIVQEKGIDIYITCANNNDSIEYINKLSLALEEYLSNAKNKVRVIICG